MYARTVFQEGTAGEMVERTIYRILEEDQIDGRLVLDVTEEDVAGWKRILEEDNR